ncbi:MAG TPA: class I SAM-dependent methyltransferase [Pyrinomonadaceae bacterium]|nr:class I SAM-dependent methyltransferase [Pyrinomonadaceae bacterium]
MKWLFDKTVLGLFRTVPVRAAHHALFLAQSHPELPERWGYHIRPIHYYEPLPDFRAITLEQIQRRRNYAAIDFQWDDQLRLLRELEPYAAEVTEVDVTNDYFSGVDAIVYYSLIRHLKPRRIIEIGGGYSTRFAAKALVRNADGATLTCIEPNPERLNGHALNIELIQKRVEEIDVDFFSQLEANDIIFIDSSHTVKFGSDVCYEFLDVLPVLRPGVWVHVHDIFFPHDYPAEWILKRRLALNEQYLLEAFLSFNREFQVALANHWLTLDHAPAVNELWTGDTVSSSFWFYRRETND